MTRVDNWPARLSAFIEARRHMPFKWGVHDCCQFARAALAELRGTDPAAALDLRPYRRSSGAAVNLRRLGGVEAIPGQCGLEEVCVPLARRGDVVSHASPSSHHSHPSLGICLGDQSAFPGKRGLVFVPMLSCRRAWRV